MEQQEEGKSEKAFKSFGKKVDQFVIELDEAGKKLEQEFQERFEELKASAEKLKQEAKDKEKWKEVETSLKKAGDELSKAFRATFGK